MQNILIVYLSLPTEKLYSSHFPLLPRATFVFLEWRKVWPLGLVIEFTGLGSGKGRPSFQLRFRGSEPLSLRLRVALPTELWTGNCDVFAQTQTESLGPDGALIGMAALMDLEPEPEPEQTETDGEISGSTLCTRPSWDPWVGRVASWTRRTRTRHSVATLFAIKIPPHEEESE